MSRDTPFLCPERAHRQAHHITPAQRTSAPTKEPLHPGGRGQPEQDTAGQAHQSGKQQQRRQPAATARGPGGIYQRLLGRFSGGCGARSLPAAPARSAAPAAAPPTPTPDHPASRTPSATTATGRRDLGECPAASGWEQPGVGIGGRAFGAGSRGPCTPRPARRSVQAGRVPPRTLRGEIIDACFQPRDDPHPTEHGTTTLTNTMEGSFNSPDLITRHRIGSDQLYAGQFCFSGRLDWPYNGNRRTCRTCNPARRNRPTMRSSGPLPLVMVLVGRDRAFG
jgi:hypothetical protein